MHTPSPKYFCPRCKTAYDTDQNYCGKCGADMHRASSLVYRRDDDSVKFERERREDPAEPDEWVGRTVDARYRVLERIGHGGMGAVYKIVHERMGKIAAMKVLHRELVQETDVVRRFRREAQAVSRLTHPNVVQVFDFGTARGQLYLVMEYVKGRDLGEIIKRDGPAPFERAGVLLYQVCAALSEAHSLGIVHRDLKPENIIVTRTRDGDDFVKVLDFGLAKLTEREELAEVTDSGSIVGTPYYMSPEQIRGEEIDARADIYSMGALAYRIITGEPPYRAQTPVGVLTKHLTAQLVPPSERKPELNIDPRVDEIIVKAMQKDPARRYQTVDELRYAIEVAYAALTGDPASTSTPSGRHLERAPSSPGGGGKRKQDKVGRTTVGPAMPLEALATNIDWGLESGQRLERADIDSFERSMSRRRWVRVLLIPLLVLGAAGFAAYYFLVRGDEPRTAEVEPNNEPDDATLIASGAPVTGYLGKRISKTESDKDCYRLAETPAADGSQAVTVHVTALPNMDIEAQLYDATGRFIAKADLAGVGREEWIRNFRVSAPLLVVVTEAGRTGLPTENVSDAYTLTVSLADADGATEIEPNDMDANAVPIQVRQPITGYLDRKGDVDAFKFTGDDGTYDVRVSGAGTAPLLIRRGGDGPVKVRTAKLKLARGDVIRVERDRDDAPAPNEAGESYLIEVLPAR